MKVLSIKKFKQSSSGIAASPPNDEQLVRIKGTLTQFVVPGLTRPENCIHCYYKDRNCSGIACDTGH